MTRKAIYLLLFFMPTYSYAVTHSEALALCTAAIVGPNAGSATHYKEYRCESPSHIDQVQAWYSWTIGTSPDGLYSAWNYVDDNPCEDTQGDVIRRSGDAGGLPATLCSSGCSYSSVGLGVEFPGSGSWNSKFAGSGSECSADSASSAATDNCITSSSGQSICYSDTDSGCGEINGQYVCTGSVPTGDCVGLPDSSEVCDSVANDPPDNGTPGVPAEPDATFDFSAGDPRDYNYYSPDTVANSSTTPPPVDDDPPPPDACDPATDPNQCQGAESCGAPGQPVCAVQVDESGTPVGTDDMFSFDVGQSLIDTIADAPGVATPAFIPTLPDASTCQSISIDFRGASGSIPDAAMCVRIEQFKNILSWFFYISTAFALFTIATRRPS